jgi:hypothetical protein
MNSVFLKQFVLTSFRRAGAALKPRTEQDSRQDEKQLGEIRERPITGGCSMSTALRFLDEPQLHHPRRRIGWTGLLKVREVDAKCPVQILPGKPTELARRPGSRRLD